jgi:hypothetical protein
MLTRPVLMSVYIGIKDVQKVEPKCKEYDGATAHEVFAMCFEYEHLVELPPNRVIVMDNTSFHRKKILYGIGTTSKK